MRKTISICDRCGCELPAYTSASAQKVNVDTGVQIYYRNAEMCNACLATLDIVMAQFKDEGRLVWNFRKKTMMASLPPAARETASLQLEGATIQ